LSQPAWCGGDFGAFCETDQTGTTRLNCQIFSLINSIF
jgi:hypothetical protein